MAIEGCACRHAQQTLPQHDGIYSDLEHSSTAKTPSNVQTETHPQDILLLADVAHGAHYQQQQVQQLLHLQQTRSVDLGNHTMLGFSDTVHSDLAHS
jgi:predicted esterase YcpF (UPF0227 family)